MSGSRQQILDRIRRHRSAAAGTSEEDRQAVVAQRLAHPSPSLVPRRAADDEGTRAQFEQRVRDAAATLETALTWADVADCVATYLRDHNLPSSVAVAPDSRLDGLDDHGLLDVRRGVALPQDLVGVTVAVAGVAETGTVALTSGDQTPTSLNFLPDVQIVCVSAADIVGGYESVWTHLRQRDAVPRTLNMVTGPSRTGDIEQTIQLGAHGPRQVHVIVVDE